MVRMRPLADDHAAITADGEAVYLAVVEATEIPGIYRSFIDRLGSEALSRWPEAASQQPF
ncbi:hypothetical protein D3C75_1372260 [compost metagenome]